MAIEAENGVKAESVKKLLEQELRIPNYQRPYSWKRETALQLVEDILEAQSDKNRGDSPYVLGTVILHQNGEKLDVVDGQQRLLTLKMILDLIDQEPKFNFSTEQSTDKKQTSPLIVQVWQALRTRLGALGEKTEFKDFINEKCQLVKVVTNDLGEAFRIFDSQNYRGKALAPHDLLKAHHLREMQGESEAMKVATVDKWEQVNDNKLDELFSTYLYRIKRWSRGHSAGKEFTVHDIGLFKGISNSKPLPPYSRYHFSAQQALLLIDALHVEKDEVAKRGLLRSRFQLDAPVIAGRNFFEMTDFMLEELEKLKSEVFDESTQEWGFTKVGKGWKAESRYRYVAQLYVAALLYFTNKFGDENLQEAMHKLFAWAYEPRVRLHRVYIETIDKLARGGDDNTQSAFVLLRNAMSGRDVHEIKTPSPSQYAEGHEKNLFTYVGGGVK